MDLTKINFLSENRLTSFLQPDLLYCLKAIVGFQIFAIDNGLPKISGKILVVFFYNILSKITSRKFNFRFYK